jgi:fatty acid desaturase
VVERMLASTDLNQAYLAFREDARERGLHERTLGAYGLYALLIGTGIVFGYYFLTVTTDPVLQCLNAVFLAFVLIQGGMLAHDLTHQEVFGSYKANTAIGCVTWGLLGGVSQSEWRAKHNAHHVHVNQAGVDPDLEIPFIFSPKQTKDNVLIRFFRPYQHIWFFIALPLVYPLTVLASTIHIARHPSLETGVELALIVAHFCWFFGITLYFLPLPLALLFYAFHFVPGGIYMSLVFAPNHKGEEVLAADETVTWLHQITSTRNLFPSRWIFVVFGGLNFQIEHHLFPTMSRFKFWQAHRMVKAFCVENGIPYHETTWLESLQQIYRALKAAR